MKPVSRYNDACQGAGHPSKETLNLPYSIQAVNCKFGFQQTIGKMDNCKQIKTVTRDRAAAFMVLKKNCNLLGQGNAYHSAFYQFAPEVDVSL